MRHTFIATTFVAAMTFAVQPAFAQRGHGGGKPAPVPHTTAKPHGPAAGGSHVKPSGGPKQHGSKPSSGPRTHGPKATGGPNAHASGHTKPSKTAAASASETKRPRNQASTTTTLTPVQQKLQRNTNLTSKLQSRLPAGTDPILASAGFRNLGQFVAAVNVSHNLGIPFSDLRTRMVDGGMSLGQAIQASKPSSNWQLEASRAEQEAQSVIADSEKAPKPKAKRRTDAPRQ